MINTYSKEKALLPKVSNRISILYIEYAKIVQTEFSVAIVQKQKQITLPVTQLNCLMLGPGTTITHDAIVNLCSAGCSILVVGQNGLRFYASGAAGTSSAKNLMYQIKYHESKTMRTAAVRRMYQIRYPQDKWSSKSLEVMRGIEGRKTQELYERCAKQYGISWTGRQYKVDDFDTQDIPNKSITITKQLMYGICNGVIHILGFHPAIGMIHQNHMEAFVFDIADLYADSITIPVAFQCAAEVLQNPGLNLYKRIRECMRQEVVDNKLMDKIVKDIYRIFAINQSDDHVSLTLWSPESLVQSGYNYGNTNLSTKPQEYPHF